MCKKRPWSGTTKKIEEKKFGKGENQILKKEIVWSVKTNRKKSNYSLKKKQERSAKNLRENWKNIVRKKTKQKYNELFKNDVVKCVWRGK